MWVTPTEEFIQRVKSLAAQFPITYKGEVVTIDPEKPPQGFDPDFWRHLANGDHLREPYWVDDPSDTISNIEV